MTTTQALDTDARIPDDIAAAAVLPASYADEENVTYPAFRWLRQNKPFGVAHVEGFDPIWLATTQADILEIERNPTVFTSGRDEPMINNRASSAFLQLMRGDAPHLGHARLHGRARAHEDQENHQQLVPACQRA